MNGGGRSVSNHRLVVLLTEELAIQVHVTNGLSKLGHTTLVVPRPCEALDVLSHTCLVGLLVDLDLPGTSLEWLSELRATYSSVVLITMASRAGLARRSLGQGAQAAFTKPLDFGRFLPATARHLAHSSSSSAVALPEAAGPASGELGVGPWLAKLSR